MVNARQLWLAAQGELQSQVSKANYETWVKNASAVSFDGDVFVVGAPNTFAKEWLEQRFLNQIRKALAGVSGRTVEVQVTVAAPQVKAKTKQKPLKASETRADHQDTSQTEMVIPKPDIIDEIPPEPVNDPTPFGWAPNPRYTFDTYVVGNSNQLAHAAATAVAEQPASTYNPLFIYGGVGLGKTHLLHAIAHKAQAHDYQVMYVSSERFTNDLINAIKERRTLEFRNRYRNVDILMIDDIQFIAGKESTQEEFFHTFNSLHDANKQIVLSSDRSPKAIVTLEERLRSRFEWGLIADIQPPDLETRIAILRAKADNQPIPVPSQVIEFVAQRVQRNIRELEGSLNRILAYASLQKRPVTVEIAVKALSDIIAAPARRFLTTNQVVDASAKYFKLDPRDLRGKRRDKALVLARQVAMYLMREETDSSLLDIGRELGGRDHTTVLHGYEKIRNEMNDDDRLRRDVLAIRETLYESSPQR
jgi:chromosomal replication initiator protein